jgi:hypothetical protein
LVNNDRDRFDRFLWWLLGVSLIFSIVLAPFGVRIIRGLRQPRQLRAEPQSFEPLDLESAALVLSWDDQAVTSIDTNDET